MRLSEILNPQCVRSPLSSTEKQQAIFELVDLLADAEQVADREELRDAVWQRELTRTTGIGHGVAIPHGKIAGCDQLCMAIGKTAQPIEFGAIDDKPVELIILLASPVDQTGPHIQVLAQISHLIIDDDFRAGMRNAQTPQEIYDLIVRQEAQAPA